MKHNFFKRICLLIVVAVSIYSFSEARQMLPAPDFKLLDTNNKQVSLSDYTKEKTSLLIFFWTTWCPYCSKELKTLNKNLVDLKMDKVAVLAIDSGEDLARIKNFISKNNLTLRVAVDEDGAVSHAYNVIGVPTFILVNREGKIVYNDNYFPQDYMEFLGESKNN